MNKKVVIVLAIISVIIIALGLFTGIGLLGTTGNPTSPSMTNIDGTEIDVAPILSTFGGFGAVALGFGLIVLAFSLVIAMWGIYGIVVLILFIIKKIKENNNKKSDN